MINIRVPMVPPSPNELRRKYRHWQAYARLRRKWEEALKYGVASGRSRHFLEDSAAHYKMRVAVTVHHLRETDPDNLVGSLKPILDALQNIKFLCNDNALHLELVPPKQELCKTVRDCRTEIWIGPIMEDTKAA
jgi:hypothetical protein